MSELHVLGIGSPFGDDQCGWEVVKLLQQRPALSGFHPDQLQIACCDRPGMYLLELMRPAQTVFLIDAVKTGGRTGRLHRFENREIEGINNTLSTHDFGIAAAMQMGASLQTLPHNVVLFGIEIGDAPPTQLQWSLSQPIRQAVNALTLRVESEILISLSHLS